MILIGRRKLTQLGLAKIGTIGLLLKAKEIGLLTEIKCRVPAFISI
jgi:predicted nucleic acid-binding protein